MSVEAACVSNGLPGSNEHCPSYFSRGGRETLWATPPTSHYLVSREMEGRPDNGGKRYEKGGAESNATGLLKERMERLEGR